MISKDILQEVLIAALSTGADFAEIFAEHTDEKSIYMIDSRVQNISDRVISGVGIRVFKGCRCISGCTTKIDLLKEAYFSAKEYHERISQVSGVFLDVDHKILVANSEGLFAQDRQIRTRLVINAVASKEGENQTGSCSPGRRMGVEHLIMKRQYKHLLVEVVAKHKCKKMQTILKQEQCQWQLKMDLVE